MTTDTTLAKQQTKIFQVLTLVNLQGMSYKEAFEQVGISDETWRRWIQIFPEAIDEFRQVITAANRQMLFDVVDAQRAIVSSLAASATDPKVPIAIQDKIAIGKWFEHLADKLTAQVGVNAEADEEAITFLGNPQFRNIPSRFTPIVNIKPKQDGSVDVSIPTPEADIIDVD